MDYHETSLRQHMAREDAEIAEAARLNESGLDRLESLARGYMASPAKIVEAANDSSDPDFVFEALATLAIGGSAEARLSARRIIGGACASLAYWNLPSEEQCYVTIAECDAIGKKLAEELL